MCTWNGFLGGGLLLQDFVYQQLQHVVEVRHVSAAARNLQRMHTQAEHTRMHTLHTLH